MRASSGSRSAGSLQCVGGRRVRHRTHRADVQNSLLQARSFRPSRGPLTPPTRSRTADWVVRAIVN